MIGIILGVYFAAAMALMGGLIFIGINEHYPKSIDVLTGLSGGFLIGIIFFGILPEGGEMIEAVYGDTALWVTAASVVGGALLIILFERMIPVQHHHDLPKSEMHHHGPGNKVYVILVAFGAHSLFELLSILVTGSVDTTMAWFLLLVIGIHNIPIGFVIYAELKAYDFSLKKSLLTLLLLGIAEGTVALVCYLMLLPFISEALQGILMGMTAGVMIYMLFDEVLPRIYKEDEQHHVNYALITGIIILYLCLNLLEG